MDRLIVLCTVSVILGKTLKVRGVLAHLRAEGPWARYSPHERIPTYIRFFEDISLARRSEWGLHSGKTRKRMLAEALQRWAIDVD